MGNVNEHEAACQQPRARAQTQVARLERRLYNVTLISRDPKGEVTEAFIPSDDGSVESLLQVPKDGSLHRTMMDGHVVGAKVSCAA